MQLRIFECPRESHHLSQAVALNRKILSEPFECKPLIIPLKRFFVKRPFNIENVLLRKAYNRIAHKVLGLIRDKKTVTDAMDGCMQLRRNSMLRQWPGRILFELF